MTFKGLKDSDSEKEFVSVEGWVDIYILVYM